MEIISKTYLSLSHAAAYAVISYQTAYLKYYYPVEFMAALLTSVKDNAYKITEYIYSCRQMGISILPPDINEGEGNFSVSGNSIRYGLCAIKGIGTEVIDGIVAERTANGKFTGLKELAERLSGKEVNKRTLENFIKAGALDSLTGTRKQKMFAYAGIVDGVNQERKSTMKGQMSFFDFLPKEEKIAYDSALPNVGEYEKDQILMFEKEVLGVYISGHPLEADEKMLLKNITAKTIDFSLDEETGRVKAPDGETAIIGGLIIDKTVKITRNNSVMAFLTIEDLYGTVEVIVFPRDYEKYKDLFIMDNKVFLWGKITVEEEKAGKLICSKILPFDQVGKELWIKFPSKQIFSEREKELLDILTDYDGKDEVCIYCEKEKAVKKLPHSRDIHVEETLIQTLNEVFGSENVRISEKSIEKIAKMN